MGWLEKKLEPYMTRFFYFFYPITGSNAQGIATLEGKNAYPPRWLTLLLLAAGSGMLTLAGWLTRFDKSEGATIPLFLYGAVAVCTAIFYFVQRRRLQKLTPAAQIRRVFALENADLQQMAEQRGILPRVNVNGEDFYDVKDFGDALSLLRASISPVQAQASTVLLRPSATNSDTPQEQLLRASIGGSETESR